MPTFNAADNTYTFKVRSGLKWSDGTPIDANTFAYSINRSLSPCTASPVTYYMFPIKDAASVLDRDLRLRRHNRQRQDQHL